MKKNTPPPTPAAPAATSEPSTAGTCTSFAVDLAAGLLELTELGLELWGEGLRLAGGALQLAADGTERLIEMLPGTPPAPLPQMLARADLFPTSGGPGAGSGLRVDAFLPGRDTPGDVGVCFSGGGSRAMVSAMGQLRGLAHLGLLGKVKAISSVSGGSWAAVCFTYLPESIADERFLGRFIADPGRLVLEQTRPPVDPAAVLDTLPEGNLGQAAARPEMAPPLLAAQGLELALQGVPESELWCRLVADNVLALFGLSGFDANQLPTSFFTYDPAQAAAIRERNPKLPRTAHVYRRPVHPGDVERPFHLCNTSMFVRPSASHTGALPPGGELLVPVQSTAFFTGVVSRPPALDAGGKPVGGGGVASFAFDSRVVRRPAASQVVVRQTSALALSDIAGMSSAFYAAILEQDLVRLAGLDPTASYWPVAGARAGLGTANRFADGGDLEDNGVASLLAYDDVDRLVVFVNSTPMKMGAHGSVEIDEWLPTLFGYTPYQRGRDAASSGYFLFSDVIAGSAPAPKPGDLMYQHNQVFPAAAFQPLLDGLWQKSGAGSARHAATYHQRRLEVLPNAWFGVAGGRTIDILWVVLNPVGEWLDQLSDEVRQAVPESFPNYDILETHLPPLRVNLLAHLTSWVVNQEAATLASMFERRGKNRRR